MTVAEEELLGRIGGQVIDFDNHLYESEDCFSRHIESKFRDEAIVPKGPQQARRWTMGDTPLCFAPPGVLIDVHAPPGFAVNSLVGKSDVDVSDMVGGGDALQAFVSTHDPIWRDRSERIKLMDQQGLQSVLMIPTSGVLVGSEFHHRPEALCANYGSFNRWLEEEWGFGQADGRIFALPIISLLDLDWAIKELDRLAGLGVRLVWMSHAPIGGKSQADPTFDPFWARFQEHGMKLVYHLGNEGFADLYASRWGEDPKRHVGEYSAFQFLLSVGERPIIDAVASLILNNLFGRFPGIELITIENGSIWVGPLLYAMDKSARMAAKGTWPGGQLSERPSEIFKSHVYVNPYHEEPVASLVDIMGADRVIFGSDYPHPEGLADPVEYLQKALDELSAEDTKKVVHDNAAALLGL